MVVVFGLTACEDDPMVDGLWSDIIKFDSKKASFDKDGGSKTIKSKGDWWWILDYIFVGGEAVYLYDNPSITIEKGKIKGWDREGVIYDEGADMEIKKIVGEWFVITKDSYKSLIIEATPNETGKPRAFILHIEAGNYFDYIEVSQSAN